MEEYERVRKEMAEELRTYAGKWSGLVDWGQVLIENPEYFLEKANRLLSIKGIRIESDDQSLPRVGSILPSTRQDEQRKMLEAGFVKCIKRREHGS